MAEGKKSSKAGRNSKKCTWYKTNKTREKNKLIRISRSNGHEEAKYYAKKHGLSEWFSKNVRA